MLWALLLSSTTLNAFQSGNFRYYVDSGSEVVITEYFPQGGNVIIPSTIAGMAVVAIGNSAFVFSRKLTSVTIPESVKVIGNDAFSGCTGLTNVTILNGVTSIRSRAFSGCTGLSSITIPNSVTNARL